MNPICPRCSFRQREWRKDRQKFRPTCKLCRVPASNVERRLRRAGRPVVKQISPNYAALSLSKRRCEACGFIAAHPCQLDIDHKDGDSLNDDLMNLQVLCANCHRLKTFLNDDVKLRQLHRSFNRLIDERQECEHQLRSEQSR